MKRLPVSLLFIVLLLFFCPVCAFCSDLDCEYNDALKKAFPTETVAGFFRQEKRIKGGTRCLVSTGKVLIDPDAGIAWLTEKPYQMILLVGKDTFIQSVKGGKPVKSPVSDIPEYSQIAQVLSAVFSGDTDSIFKNFEADIKKSDSSYFMVLYPRDSMIKSFMDRVEVCFSSALDSVLMVQKTGDSVLYQFSNMQTREFTSDEKEIYGM